MISDDQAITRLDSLVGQLRSILAGKGTIGVCNEELFGECEALLYAAKNACLRIFEDNKTTYALAINALELETADHAGAYRSNKIAMITLKGMLEHVKEEIIGGFFHTLASQVQAGVFDDFIDHADLFARNGKKNEAGVVAGVTFEDTVRKLCLKQGIAEKGRRLDELISDLSKTKILNELEAKRARVAAHVRTKATHAQWDEFDLDAVNETIGFVRNILLLRLAR